MRTTAYWRTDWLILLAMVAGLWAGFLSLLFLQSEPAAATVRPGFEDRLVGSVGGPMDLAFTPDGRMLIIAKTGQVRVYKNGQLLQTPALNISSRTCTRKESGLSGVALDPAFGTAGHNYVYLFYTFKKSSVCPTDWNPANPDNPVNRVSRFVMSGDSIDPLSEQVLIDNIPNPAAGHVSGDLSFGKNGYLYVTVGDGECDYAQNSGCQPNNDASRDSHALVGKILRITPSGGIPAGNPYQGPDSDRCNVDGRTDPGKKCQETFASGLRNPFRFAFDPDASGTRFFINDVGYSSWEEIDVGKVGADYAWNLCEGNHDNPSSPGSVDCSAAPYTPPIHEYSHDSGCSAITGGAFVPNGTWPAEYDNSYLFGDYVCNKIFELTPDGAGGFTQTEFASELGQGGPIAMTFGPHGSGQALYYITGLGAGGEVRRIAYTGNTNRPPTAEVVANPTSGDPPLTVNFDASASSDPDAGDTLSYIWDFGDDSATQTSSTPTTSHTYLTEGTFTASVSVKDNHGALSDPKTVRIYSGNEAPTPLMELPSSNLLYRVGQQIPLRGSATDREDAQLPPGSLRWEVLKHHTAPNHHTHPYFSQTGNDLTIFAPPPEGLDSTGSGNHLEVRLTATDSEGLSKTVTREIQPNRVNVTFATNPSGLSPSGLSVLINGQTFTTPKTLLSWEGYKLDVNAPSPQTRSGKTYVFSSWSDGKGKQRQIVTEAAPSTYTATFKTCTKRGTSAGEILSGTTGADVICGLGGDDTIDGLGGNDILLGGGGADTVKGSGEADSLYGQDGNDALDSLDGVSGNDTLNGGPGTDTKTTDSTEKSIVGFP